MTAFDKRTFDQITDFIEHELDFSVSFYNRDYLERRIQSRIRRCQCDDLQSYYDLVTQDEEEQEALLAAFSINVTGFFRNQDVWNHITELLRDHPTDRQYRVWSAGCADGREPYSVALLALSDPHIDADQIDIIGTDINKEALETAREGVYTNTITDDLTEQLDYLRNATEYTREDGDQIEVTDTAKQLVDIEYHDIIRDDPKKNLDLVLCRNLLIYLNRDHETAIFRTIAESLREGGHLVIGKAETMPDDIKHRFRSINASRRIYQFTG